MYYFAYGSNLLSARLQARTPSATIVAQALLPGHTLRFHKRGSDGSGKCDAFAADTSGAALHGVVYEISSAELPDLDAAEGAGRGYRRTNVEVQTPTGQRIAAATYIATAIDASLTPYDWYRALVLAGAIERRLPVECIERLRAITVTTDPDRARSDRHFALIPLNLRPLISAGAG